VDALSKYLWNFEVYYGKSRNSHDGGGNDCDAENRADVGADENLE
jgi:hypothetical protein